ncbi:hypothetical protein UPYG_G00038730 [Umbra pygmaea]|uniref:Protein Largen n=1 Tax=Umbra pygmaea TaxID=75934 RepID=A0ABD0YDJ3_UMBPY
MFSDTSTPEEHRGFQQRNTDLNLWLHNGLRAHRSDLGLNRQWGSTDGNLTHSNRVKQVSFTSQEVMDSRYGKEKIGPQLNGLGLEARRLHFASLYVQSDLSSQEGSPHRWSQGLSPELGLRHSTSVRNQCIESPFVGNHQQTLPHPSVRKYVTASTLAPDLPAQFKIQDGCKTPVCLEDTLWSCPRQTCQRDLNTFIQMDSPTVTQEFPRHEDFSSSLKSTSEKTRSSHRDTTRPVSGPETRLDREDLTRPVEGYNGPSSLHKIIFSAAIPQRAPTLRCLQSPSKAFPLPEHNQPRPPSATHDNRRGSIQTGSKRSHQKAVQDQIRRVVKNLEEVLGGLKDVHQEMKEVVQQIELLTSSIDLREGEVSPNLPSGSSSTSSSSGVAMGSSHQRPGGGGARQGGLALLHPIGADSPQTHKPVCLPYLPASKGSPVRPPTPGVSPLRINPHNPNTYDPPGKNRSPHHPRNTASSPNRPEVLCLINPASNAALCHNLGLSPHTCTRLTPPSAPGPSVTVEAPAGPHIRECLPDSPLRAPQTQTWGEGVRPTSPQGQRRVPGSRGRKPPPYPHNRLLERVVSKGNDLRKAPPYPGKRRLLSTTV